MLLETGPKSCKLVEVYHIISVPVGNRIGDVGMENLCKILDTLPNLSVLDLTCNDITPVGLNHLCSAITVEETKCLQVSHSCREIVSLATIFTLNIGTPYRTCPKI